MLGAVAGAILLGHLVRYCDEIHVHN